MSQADAYQTIYENLANEAEPDLLPLLQKLTQESVSTAYTIPVADTDEEKEEIATIFTESIMTGCAEEMGL